MSAHFEDGDYVIGILFRFQIEDQRWKSDDPKRGRCENSAFET
jgi:hypothetical protein